MRDWLNLGRPAEPQRRVIIEPTTPYVSPLRCSACKRALIGTRETWQSSSSIQIREVPTHDTCSFRCALAVFEREEAVASAAAEGP